MFPMAPPPDATGPAAFHKHKKKKGMQNEAGNEAKEEAAPGSVETLTAHEQIRTEERKQGDEATPRRKKKRQKQKDTENQTVAEMEMHSPLKQKESAGLRSEERRQGDEKTRKKERRGKEGNNDQTETGEKQRSEENQEENREMSKKTRKRTRTEEAPTEVCESELQELEQFIPDVQKKSAEVIQKLLRYDLQRFREFRQKGQTLRRGRYSSEENLQIRRNVVNFLSLTGIGSAMELLFPQRFPQRERELKKLKVQHRFYQSIAEGVLRTCEQVHVRAKKMYDLRNHMGRFSEDEMRTLEKLHTLHGNDWKTIGNKLDRSIYACQKRYATMGTDRGTWTSEEMHCLRKAVKKHLKRLIHSNSTSGPDPGLSPSLTWVQLCSNLPWKDISLKVRTRSWVQCRLKWFSYLKLRLNGGRKLIPGSAVQTRISLIQTLYELQVDDVSDVDWIEVAEAVGNVTPMCAQKGFHRMKVSRVPSWSHRSFGEIVDFLFETELPRLKKKLDKMKCERLEQNDINSISLDDIFPPKDQDDFIELDNS